MDQTLIDRIYECAFAPEFWPGVLEELAKIAEARGGAFLTANGDGGVLRWTCSTALHDDVASYIEQDWLHRDKRTRRVVRAHHQGFLTERDLFTEEELETDPTRQEFYRPRGLGWIADTAAPLPTGDWFIFTLPRPLDRGPVEPGVIELLDELRPHLARSSFMSARLQLERARAASDTLALIGLPALVLSETGRVLAANRLIETLGGHILWRARDRIALTDADANAQLDQAISTFQRSAEPCVRSFAVRDREGAAAMVAHVVPVRGAAQDIFSRSTAVMILTSVTAPQAPPVELIRSLFDLTPSEARVARRLAAGDTLEEIADAGGTSRNTVRTQVRGVLEKTGCRRQSEVIALLGGISLPGAQAPSAVNRAG